MWTTPKDLKARLTKLWERGDLLRDAVTGQTSLPLRLPLKGPSSSDITERFESVRQWASDLSQAGPVRIAWQDVRHRVQGQQSVPTNAWIDTLEDALSWLGKRRDWDRFSGQVSCTRSTHPTLLPWLEKRPLQALALWDDWPRLLAVVSWCQAHPRPGIYLRQVDVPGVHTKFIEAHRGVLTELLDLALPPDAVDASKTGVSQFNARYGFLDKPHRIRFRILDPDIQAAPGTCCPDIALDTDSFSRLSLDLRRVFIAENEINFLALPSMPRAMVIFGAGYGWEAFAKARWLMQPEIYYWGDIDTHGFAILDQLRGHFPHVQSFLMNRATLDAHRTLWGTEDKPLQLDLERLNPEERALYDTLRDNRIRAGLRLEQEHVGYRWLCDELERIVR